MLVGQAHLAVVVVFLAMPHLVRFAAQVGRGSMASAAAAAVGQTAVSQGQARQAVEAEPLRLQAVTQRPIQGVAAAVEVAST